MAEILIKIFGPAMTVYFGDAAVADRFRWLKKRLRKGPLRTLDAGCGSGAFSFYAARAGNEVVGISFQEENNRTASARAAALRLKNAKFITGDLRRLDAMAGELGYFDQVICFETIEHILDDRKLLRDLSQLLKPGGQVLLTTPYKHYRRLPGDSVSPVENGDHVRWGYTREELGALCMEAGLAVAAADYVSGFLSQKLVVWERSLSHALPSKLAWALVFPLRIVQVFDPLIMKFISYPYLSVAVAAEKRA